MKGFAKCVFVNRSKSSTYHVKVSKICDSTQSSLVGSYVHSLLILKMSKMGFTKAAFTLGARARCLSTILAGH